MFNLKKHAQTDEDYTDTFTSIQNKGELGNPPLKDQVNTAIDTMKEQSRGNIDTSEESQESIQNEKARDFEPVAENVHLLMMINRDADITPDAESFIINQLKGAGRVSDADISMAEEASKRIEGPLADANLKAEGVASALWYKEFKPQYLPLYNKLMREKGSLAFNLKKYKTAQMEMPAEEPPVEPQAAEQTSLLPVLPVEDLGDFISKITRILASGDEQQFNQAQSEITRNVGDIMEEEAADAFGSLRDFLGSSEEEEEIGSICIQIYRMLPTVQGEEAAEPIGEVTTGIGEPPVMAQSFNLSKHGNKKKKMEKEAYTNLGDAYILYGPTEKRVCPKLVGRGGGKIGASNVVSEEICRFHCLDGIIIDDNKTICGEALWRANQMEKFNREYVDADGKIVGGTLNKRFEIDRNVPEENRMRLKPGETRKPRPPSWGVTESRMQAMRNKEGQARDYRPATNTGQPFNWQTDVDQNNVEQSQAERDRREEAMGNQTVQYTDKEKIENNPKMPKQAQVSTPGKILKTAHDLMKQGKNEDEIREAMKFDATQDSLTIAIGEAQRRFERDNLIQHRLKGLKTAQNLAVLPRHESPERQRSSQYKEIERMILEAETYDDLDRIEELVMTSDVADSMKMQSRLLRMLEEKRQTMLQQQESPVFPESKVAGTKEAKKWMSDAVKDKGSFTDYCGGKVTQECIDKGKKSPDTKTKRRANLAETFRSEGKKRKKKSFNLKQHKKASRPFDEGAAKTAPTQEEPVFLKTAQAEEIDTYHKLINAVYKAKTPEELDAIDQKNASSNMSDIMQKYISNAISSRRSQMTQQTVVAKCKGPDKPYNPYAVCKSQDLSPEKEERCIKHVKDQNKKSNKSKKTAEDRKAIKKRYEPEHDIPAEEKKRPGYTDEEKQNFNRSVPPIKRKKKSFNLQDFKKTAAEDKKKTEIATLTKSASPWNFGWAGYDNLTQALDQQIRTNQVFRDKLETILGFDGISDNDALLDAALTQAEAINQATEVDSDTLEVWLTKDGSFVVDVPNELAKTAQSDDDTKVQRCGHCREARVFRKDRRNEWYCSGCQQHENPKQDAHLVPPFIRSLPYGGGAVAQSWKTLKTAQKSMLWKHKKDPEKLRQLLEEKDKQEEIEETCKALALDS